MTAGRYEVVGVWRDGNPTLLSSWPTLREALDVAAAERATGIPAVGVNDSEDYELGFLEEDDA